MSQKNLKLVFQGKIFDVYQWDQLVYDGTYQVFERIQRCSSVEVICTQGNNILIAHQEQPHKPKPFYSFFGGMMEKGETPLYAAQRELLEESGMKSDNMYLYKEFSMIGIYNAKSNIIIAKDVYEFGPQQLDSGEKIEIKKVTFDELINLMIYDNFRTSREFLIEIMRMKIDGKLDEFKKILLG